jgi:hypothetical protein
MAFIQAGRVSRPLVLAVMTAHKWVQALVAALAHLMRRVTQISHQGQ